MRLAPALLAALCAALPAAARAQSGDTGPMHVVPFAGYRVADGKGPLIGVGGELALRRGWSVGIAASRTNGWASAYIDQYEATVRVTGASEGWLRPYVGVGVAVLRTGTGVGNASSTQFAGVGLAGALVRVIGLDFFVEGVAAYDGRASAALRGGLQLLVWR